jgi:hypothetical protein
MNRKTIICRRSRLPASPGPTPCRANDTAEDEEDEEEEEEEDDEGWGAVQVHCARHLTVLRYSSQGERSAVISTSDSSVCFFFFCTRPLCDGVRQCVADHDEKIIMRVDR